MLTRQEITKRYRERHPERVAMANARWMRTPAGQESRRRTHKKASSRRTKEINRRYALKSNYGLTPEDHAALIIAQGGKCALCETVLTRSYVDHNHVTGEVRGILCLRCNTALGFYEKDKPHFAKYEAYISQPPARKVIAPKIQLVS